MLTYSFIKNCFYFCRSELLFSFALYFPKIAFRRMNSGIAIFLIDVCDLACFLPSSHVKSSIIPCSTSGFYGVPWLEVIYQISYEVFESMRI